MKESRLQITGTKREVLTKYHTIKKPVISSKKRNNSMNLYASNHIASKGTMINLSSKAPNKTPVDHPQEPSRLLTAIISIKQGTH